MGYKSSMGNFEEMYKQWSDPKFWSSFGVEKDVFLIYGQAKLDCLIAGMKYSEDLAGMHPTENMFWELTDWYNKTQFVSSIIDTIILETINW